ncbi:hypothetical protein [Pelotomaculum terephthalicicum]|nr:hypothetical protein [Pelotomaculum terephthalicicum]
MGLKKMNTVGAPDKTYKRHLPERHFFFIEWFARAGREGEDI